MIIQRHMLHQLHFLNKFKNNNGYVALMSVLVISAVGMVIAVSLLVTSMLYQRSNFSLEEGYRANSLAKACLNIALEKISFNSLYIGDESINFENDHCEILPLIKEGDTYTIYSKGIAGLSEKKNKIIVVRIEDIDTFEVSMQIEYWKEVADF
jgi:hypothetical protein